MAFFPSPPKLFGDFRIPPSQLFVPWAPVDTSTSPARTFRTASPEWEQKEREPSSLALDSDQERQKIEKLSRFFVFKHRVEGLEHRNEKRASQRKRGTLDKFLASVEISRRRRQFDTLPFHSLSTGKQYKGFVDHSRIQNSVAGYFQSDFEDIERIGFGNFAEVFRARWKQDGRVYAVKRSVQRFTSCFGAEEPSEEQLRWMDEAFYHSAISGHSNIVEFVQSWEEAGYFHIQMEFMPVRLDNYADEYHPLPERRLWTILADMLMAVAHLEKSGYCHLDIKPENIFMDQDGVTKLGDFSLITMPEVDKKEAGDGRYMPMEALDAASLGFPIDVFSLGITMLELSTDLSLESHGDTWRALRETRWPAKLQQRIPIRMQPVLRQMMSQNPRLRPSAASLMKIYPINRYVFWRRCYFMFLPLLRFQRRITAGFTAVVHWGLKWMKAWLGGSLLPSSEDGYPKIIRPDTPPPDRSMLERYSFCVTPKLRNGIREETHEEVSGISLDVDVDFQEDSTLPLEEDVFSKSILERFEEEEDLESLCNASLNVQFSQLAVEDDVAAEEGDDGFEGPRTSTPILHAADAAGDIPFEEEERDDLNKVHCLPGTESEEEDTDEKSSSLIQIQLDL